MSSISAAITAVGAYVPEHILSNTDLESMVDTNDEWIVSRTGIKERRIINQDGVGTSHLAIKAIENMFSKKEINPKEIDLVILATVTPDMPVATSATYIASEIGAINAFSFDLQAACSGFLYGMSVASSMIMSGRYKKVLLVGADKMSSIIDYKDRATCIIFGDGGGAVLMEPNTEGLGFQDEYLRGDGIGREFLRINAGGSIQPVDEKALANGDNYLRQEGQTVFKYAVSNMSKSVAHLMKKNNLTAESLDWLLAHQANKRIIDATASMAKLDKSKVLVNIQRYGNTTAATLPLLLRDFENQFKKGDQMIFTTFGGGFTWGAAYYKWAY